MTNEVIDMSSNSVEVYDDNFVALAEKRIDVIKKVKSLVLKVTNPKDWVKFGDTNYLDISGCQKVARLFGISWTTYDCKKTLHEDGSGHYIYSVKGDFWISKNIDEKITEIGTRSSTCNFFGKINGQLRPASTIDETNIHKSAITNCVVRGVTAILGLKNISDDEIGGSVDINKFSSITYAKGGLGGGKISEGQRKRLYACYKNNNITNDQMKDYLLTEYNLESSKDIERGEMYENIIKWAKSKQDK